MNLSKQEQPTDNPRNSNAAAAQAAGSSDGGQKNAFQPPVINLPKGGGAIQGIGEKFQANPVTGMGV